MSQSVTYHFGNLSGLIFTSECMKSNSLDKGSHLILLYIIRNDPVPYLPILLLNIYFISQKEPMIHVPLSV